MKPLILAAVLLLNMPLAAPARAQSQNMLAIDRAATVIIRGATIEGTGVLVARHGWTYTILTARHIAQVPGSKTIIFADRTYAIADHQYTYLSSLDIALLRVTVRLEAPVVTLAAKDPVAGARLWVIGHPLGTYWHTSPALSNDSEENNQVDRILCEGCTYGDSGAGVYDDSGNLVGEFFAASERTSNAAWDTREKITRHYDPRIVRFGFVVPSWIVRAYLHQVSP